MLTGTELEILKSIGDRGGRSTISIIASKVGMSTDYARICCTSIGNTDYIDLKRSGQVEITPLLRGLKPAGSYLLRILQAVAGTRLSSPSCVENVPASPPDSS